MLKLILLRLPHKGCLLYPVPIVCVFEDDHVVSLGIPGKSFLWHLGRPGKCLLVMRMSPVGHQRSLGLDPQAAHWASLPFPPAVYRPGSLLLVLISDRSIWLPPMVPLVRTFL